jgi:hypothetical protein
MAQIPTSSIRMDLIRDEVGLSGSVTLDACRAASNAFAMTSTSVPGHTRDGNEQTNTVTSPWYNTMAEWAGYTHALSMGTIDYDIRMASTSVGDRALYGLNHYSTDSAFDDNAHACGGILLFRTYDGSNTYVKVKFFGDGLSTRQIYDTSNTNGATATTGTTVITIPVTDVTITAAVSYLSGDTVNYPLYGGHPSGAATMSGTGATLLVCKGSDQVDVDPIGDDETEAKFHIALSAAKTGYTTTLLNKGTSGYGIIVHSGNQADADSEE